MNCRMYELVPSEDQFPPVIIVAVSRTFLESPENEVTHSNPDHDGAHWQQSVLNP